MPSWIAVRRPIVSWQANEGGITETPSLQVELDDLGKIELVEPWQQASTRARPYSIRPAFQAAWVKESACVPQPLADLQQHMVP